jgi:hypothetical protein
MRPGDRSPIRGPTPRAKWRYPYKIRDLLSVQFPLAHRLKPGAQSFKIRDPAPSKIRRVIVQNSTPPFPKSVTYSRRHLAPLIARATRFICAPDPQVYTYLTFGISRARRPKRANIIYRAARKLPDLVYTRISPLAPHVYGRPPARAAAQSRGALLRQRERRAPRP